MAIVLPIRNGWIARHRDELECQYGIGRESGRSHRPERQMLERLVVDLENAETEREHEKRPQS